MGWHPVKDRQAPRRVRPRSAIGPARENENKTLGQWLRSSCHIVRARPGGRKPLDRDRDCSTPKMRLVEIGDQPRSRLHDAYALLMQLSRSGRLTSDGNTILQEVRRACGTACSE